MLKDITGFEGLYAISSNGKVWCYPREITQKNRWGGVTKRALKSHWLRANTNKTGDWYMSIALQRENRKKRKGFKIHRLIAEAFIPNPLNLPEVNHINGIKTDNRIKNLEWVTRKENLAKGYKTLPIRERTLRRGAQNRWAKLTQEQAEEIRQIYKNKKSRFSTEISTRKLAKIYNVSFPTIGNIVRNKSYL